jgi:hypothetical protein
MEKISWKRVTIGVLLGLSVVSTSTGLYLSGYRRGFNKVYNQAACEISVLAAGFDPAVCSQ